MSPTFVFPAGEASKQLSTVLRDVPRPGPGRASPARTSSSPWAGGVAGDMGGFAAATYPAGHPLPPGAHHPARPGGRQRGRQDRRGPARREKTWWAPSTSPTPSSPTPRPWPPCRSATSGTAWGRSSSTAASHDRPSLCRPWRPGTALEDLEHAARPVRGHCKKALVEQDARDTGRRMILNFGHTFGHALEKLHGFQDLAHGEAVGIGMVLACQAGERLGVTPAGHRGPAGRAAVLRALRPAHPGQLHLGPGRGGHRSGQEKRRHHPAAHPPHPARGEPPIYPVTRDRAPAGDDPGCKGRWRIPVAQVIYGNQEFHRGAGAPSPPSKSAAHRQVLGAALSRGAVRPLPRGHERGHRRPPSAAVEALGVRTCALTTGTAAALTVDARRPRPPKTPPSTAGSPAPPCGSSSPCGRGPGGPPPASWAAAACPAAPWASTGSCCPPTGWSCPGHPGRPAPWSSPASSKAASTVMPGNVSSQFVTGLLIALPLLEGDSEIVLTSPLESQGYVGAHPLRA